MMSRLRWERMLEFSLVATILLFIVMSVAPTWKADQNWRIRLHKAVLVDRLVNIGFHRPEAYAAVASLSPKQLAGISASIGTPRPAGWLLSIVALLMLSMIFIILRLVWS